jgi:hypothetical protein
MKNSQISTFFAAHLQNQNTLATNIQRGSGYLARQEIENLKEKIKLDSKRLEPYGFKIYSQGDEDGIIYDIFNRLNIECGTFCEIGVENGLECNSLALIHRGWKGIWLEGNEEMKEFIEEKFSSILNNQRLGLGIGMVTPNNINLVVEKMSERLNFKGNILDFLSIDIDGMDIYLLEAITFSPKVICIEYNAKFPPPLIKKPIFDEGFCWRGTDYVGSSLAAITESANKKGYTLVGTSITGVNAFYVRNDLVGPNFSSQSLEELYNPPRYYLIIDHYLNNVGHQADFGPYEDLS